MDQFIPHFRIFAFSHFQSLQSEFAPMIISACIHITSCCSYRSLSCSRCGDIQSRQSVVCISSRMLVAVPVAWLCDVRLCDVWCAMCDVWCVIWLVVQIGWNRKVEVSWMFMIDVVLVLHTIMQRGCIALQFCMLRPGINLTITRKHDHHHIHLHRQLRLQLQHHHRHHHRRRSHLQSQDSGVVCTCRCPMVTVEIWRAEYQSLCWTGSHALYNHWPWLLLKSKHQTCCILIPNSQFWIFCFKIGSQSCLKTASRCYNVMSGSSRVFFHSLPALRKRNILFRYSSMAILLVSILVFLFVFLICRDPQFDSFFPYFRAWHFLFKAIAATITNSALNFKCWHKNETSQFHACVVQVLVDFCWWFLIVLQRTLKSERTWTCACNL